jgi:hypothetical protein
MGNSRICSALAAKRLSSMWLCAGPDLVMSTAEEHLLKVSGDEIGNADCKFLTMF